MDSDSHLRAEKQDQKKPLVVTSLVNPLMTALWFTKGATLERTTGSVSDRTVKRDNLHCSFS